MGLFDRKKEEYTLSQPLYTIGSSSTVLVVGLGNVGAKYAKTRHNVGYVALDRYQQSHDFSPWIEKKDLKCQLSTGTTGSTRVLLAKPTTMMNLSGESLQLLLKFYKIQDSDSLVIYDELALDFGTIRTRKGGSSAGHNGVKSLIVHSSNEYDRIRIGIGPKQPAQIDSADFVLQDFSSDEQDRLPKILKEVCALIDERTVGALAELTLNV